MSEHFEQATAAPGEKRISTKTDYPRIVLPNGRTMVAADWTINYRSDGLIEFTARGFEDA